MTLRTKTIPFCTSTACNRWIAVRMLMEEWGLHNSQSTCQRIRAVGCKLEARSIFTGMTKRGLKRPRVWRKRSQTIIDCWIKIANLATISTFLSNQKCYPRLDTQPKRQVWITNRQAWSVVPSKMLNTLRKQIRQKGIDCQSRQYKNPSQIKTFDTSLFIKIIIKTREKATIFTNLA